MSTRELYRFLDGETISGNTEWRREGYASSSKGICFFPADPKPETRDLDRAGNNGGKKNGVIRKFGYRAAERSSEFRGREGEAAMASEDGR